uniref:Uncharacterized protein n=1 Tax=uncultured marine virus TaxID=186617 RepID=A0A0F7L827_9VIRU|nr:hypothetical protein [uncultured marine virus]
MGHLQTHLHELQTLGPTNSYGWLCDEGYGVGMGRYRDRWLHTYIGGCND